METKTKVYSLSAPSFQLCRDSSNRSYLRFHAEKNEYFATLATALSFVEEKLEKIERQEVGRYSPSQELVLVRQLRDDLKHMHNNYVIIPKV